MSTGSGSEMKALKWSIFLYAMVFGLKLAAYFMTGAMALLAEALHTLSDIFVSGFLLIALVVSKKPADENHPFGHGRAQHVGALVAATLFISFTSFELYKESIPRLFAHQTASHQNLSIAVGVLVLSMLLALAPLVSLLRQKQRGAAAKAQMYELVNDQLGLIAALVGTLVVMAGYPIGDPISAMVVASIIAANGVGLFRENASFLLGASPASEVLEKMKTAALAVAGVNGLHGLRAQCIGPEEIQAELHIEVNSGLLVEDGHKLAYEVRKRIREEVAGADCVVHVDTEKPAV